MPTSKILIIEDDKDYLYLMERALIELNIKNPILRSRNGEEGLKLIRSVPDDIFIIISDINMPRMNGLELLKEIYADVALRVKAIPFIFFTNSATQAEINLAYALSAQGYFTKPDAYEDLLEIMNNILKYWSQSRLPH